ncbi:MAG TPA: protein kinase [Blastocatellia bacterium]
MQAERWRQVDALFDAALERDASERTAFLNEACAGDEALRREVESLLAAHERAGDFIETPASDSSAESAIKEKTCLIAGQRIAHYEIISRLGAGGMGEVYLARDTKLTRNVAVKLLPGTLTADNQARGRFLREAQLAATLDHPNICTIHEIGEDTGQSFIAMQYVEGKTLKDLLADQPLSVKNLLAISLQVADALSTAHEKGIIHRDIKSTNIMITPRGQVKVLDFGLAKLMDERSVGASATQAELTQTGVIIGTPAYMSPEQARGERADNRSDIFSVGVLIYEMAAGRLPFKARSQPETLNAIINEPHSPVSKSNKEVSAELCAVIDRAMAKEPARRYQSMKEMKDELWRAAQAMGFSGSIDFEELTLPYRTLKTQSMSQIASWSRVPSTRNLALAGLGALILALALFVVFRLSRTGSATNATAIDSVAVMPMLNASSNADLEFFADGITDGVINNLSQLSALKVMSHSSVFRYKGKDIDPQTAARELKVQAVVLSQIVSRGDSISINVEMVDPRDNHQIWGQRYERRLSDVIPLPADISRDLSSKLRVKSTSEEQKLLARRYTENNEAYQLYLRGRFHLDRRTRRDSQTSVEYFEQATKIDPNYALAYAGLAEAYDSLINLGTDFAPRDIVPKANAAAARAVELDDTLAEAHLALAYALWNDLRNGQADAIEREFRRAVELNPNLVSARRWYALSLAEELRFDEAISQIKRTVEIDPLAAFTYRVYGQILYLARRYDEAIEQCKKALELDPHFTTTYGWLGKSYEMKGMYDKAFATEMNGLAVSGANSQVVEELKKLYKASGWKGFWQKVIEMQETRTGKRSVGVMGGLAAELKSHQPQPDELAKEHLRIGEKEEALRWLEKGFAASEPWIGELKADPFWDGLRAEPRFQDLLRRIGAPQ